MQASTLQNGMYSSPYSDCAHIYTSIQGTYGMLDSPNRNTIMTQSVAFQQHFHTTKYNQFFVYSSILFINFLFQTDSNISHERQTHDAHFPEHCSVSQNTETPAKSHVPSQTKKIIEYGIDVFIFIKKKKTLCALNQSGYNTISIQKVPNLG